MDSQNQIYSKIVIEQKDADTQKIDIDFLFSDLQLVISLSTFERLIKFSKKLQPPEPDIFDDDIFSRNTMRGSTITDLNHQSYF